MWKKHIRELAILAVFLIGAIGIGISSTVLNLNQSRNTTSAEAAFSFDQYCRNGVYYVKSPKDGSEMSCGRAANCGGTSYTDTAKIDYRSNGKCWLEDSFGGDRCKAYCAGYVPLCCYKMAESGNAEDCAWPERKYCRQDQCKEAKKSDSSCGAGINSYCVQIDHCIADREDVPVLSLEDRLEGKKSPGTVAQQPTNTPPPQATAVPTATPIPTTRPTNTPIPQGNTNTGNGNPTSTPILTATPVPTSTSVPSQNQNQGGGNFGFGGNQNSNTNTGQVLPTIPLTNTPAPQNTTENNTALLPTFSVPHFEVQTPKELAKNVVNENNVQKLNDITDPPLVLAKNTFISVKTYDKSLEDTVRNWIEQLRSEILKRI